MRVKDDRKRQRICEKAIDMIVAKGFDGLSMHKLAKSARISASTIYIYFPGREELLNQVFNEVEAKFEEDALRGFDPSMDFQKGLWLQWINRYKNIVNNPRTFQFFEQFRHSPLIKHRNIKGNTFRIFMSQFVKKAMDVQEIVTIPVELFWAMAYGPFYALIKFHLDQATMANEPFALSEEKLRQTFNLVIKALKI